jgi:hypothetical protein
MIGMNTPQPPSPRRRLQALLAIPDNQRTDAEWDELHELEIQLAPGNRVGGPEPGGARRGPPPASGNPRPGGSGQPGGGGQPGKKPFRKPRKKAPPKSNPA